MYDYSNFYARMINPWCLIILLIIIVITVWKIIDKNLNLKSKEFIVRVALPFAISGITILSLLISMRCAETKSTTTVFHEKQNRGFNAAPMFTDTYIFETPSGDRVHFNMDSYAIQRIYPGGMKKNKEYTVYYKDGKLIDEIIIGIEETKQ